MTHVFTSVRKENKQCGRKMIWTCLNIELWKEEKNYGRLMKTHEEDDQGMKTCRHDRHEEDDQGMKKMIKA